MQSSLSISVITVDNQFISIFTEIQLPQSDRGGMLLTDRIDALNFRIRESEAGYESSWHVAGDPTMIIIQQGILRIVLRNEESKDFSSGDIFIAQDYLPDNTVFDEAINGHRAEVIGDEKLKAVHIKLSSRF
ncbi:MAG: hypothetical protein AAF363_08945 [Bacteroidota bacterium]